MNALDRVYTEHPYYGSRRLTAQLQQDGYSVCRDRVRRLMGQLGLEALYPKPRLSIPNKADTKYPYLLNGLVINRVNQVWSSDITYIPIQGGFMYLTAVLDWYSRYVLSWRISNTMETQFCYEALEEAVSRHGRPEKACRRVRQNPATQIRGVSSRLNCTRNF